MQHTRWQVAFIAPGEEEVALLSELSRRKDTEIVAVVDPAGSSIGGAIAEVMSIPVVTELTAKACAAAEYIIYPADYSNVGSLFQITDQLEQQAVTPEEFHNLLGTSGLTRRAARPSPRGLDFLERETESIHRTLSRIEEALERESLLRWLLSLATRAVQATSGSIMLLDENTQDLYIAFAYGLSEGTLHSTRVKLGEGISGRVAQTKQSELMTGRDCDVDQRDRPDILGAISAPLIWEDRLLGVLNLSVTTGDSPLTEEDLETINGLSHRFGLILARFLALQDAQLGELFRDTDRHLQELAQNTDDLQTILAAWAGSMALSVGADRLTLSVLCDDGSVLVGEGTREGDTTSWYEYPDNPAWQEVLSSGSPLVVRQQPTTDDDEESRMTVFYLPVGKDPIQAILSASFSSSASAHGFPAVSGEILYLLEKRLTGLTKNVGQQNRYERMSYLASILSELALADHNDPLDRARRIMSAARQLTGAGTAFIVRDLKDGKAVIDDIPEINREFWTEQAARLLTEARPESWRVTMFADENGAGVGEKSLLAATASQESPTPGLILFDKHRLYPTDGQVFTEYDAEIAQRLATLLLLPAHGTEQAATPDVSGETEQSGVTSSSDVLIEVLRREMDRCDRYHTVFALALFRPALTPEMEDDVFSSLVTGLSSRVRSSDYVYPLPNGVIAVIAPEDIQSLSRLQRRLVGLVHELTGVADLPIATSQTIYPGRHDNPDGLIDDTLTALDN